MNKSILLAAWLIFGLSARAALAQPQEGLYQGQWHNTTFNSTGDASFLIDFDNSNVTVTMDLDGSVFGGTDPDPLVLTGTISSSGAAVSAAGHPTYGDVSGTAGLDGSFSASATNIPNPFIESTSLAGMMTQQTINLSYTVLFSESAGGGQAEGVINAVYVPEPSAVALAGLGVLILARRRV